MKNAPDLFLKQCMKLAEKGRGSVSPNPVVGSVLVRKGKIIAQDYHRKYGEGHAERNLLSKFKGKILPSDVLVVTLEPCVHRNKKTPLCTDIILEKKVKNVVIGLRDPNPEVSGKGIQMLKKAGIEIRLVQERALTQQLVWQNRFFFTWIQKRRPWVALKIAQSLDGRITFDRGQQLWLTGKKAKEHVQKMRAAFDAILVGVKTVITDNPKLLETRPIILDAALSTPLSSHVVRPGTIIFCSRNIRRRGTRKNQLIEKGVQIIEIDADKSGFLNLHQVLSKLGAMGISSLYVEGGSSVWSSFLRQGLADELMMYIAPKVLGEGVGTFGHLTPFQGEMGLKFRGMKILGDDVYWNGYFKESVAIWSRFF